MPGSLACSPAACPAESGGKGNADYKWPNPVSKEIQPKTVYFEKADDMVFSSGYYKK